MERNEDKDCYVEILKGTDRQWYGRMVGEVFRVEGKDKYSAIFKVVHFTERQKRMFSNSYNMDFDEERLAGRNNSCYGIRKEDCVKDTFKTKMALAVLRNKNDKK